MVEGSQNNNLLDQEYIGEHVQASKNIGKLGTD